MRETHFEDGKYWVSPYNFVPEVRKELNLPPKVEIHDATLRDGEQTPGVVFSIDDKTRIATKMDEIGVDRIEVASTRVSEGEREATRLITKWARKARTGKRVEVLGYCDGKASVDWIVDTGAEVLNLLTKARHVFSGE